MENFNGLAALQSCIEILGSQTAVARAVGITPQAVSEICRRGRRVPAEWCRALETATAMAGHCVPASDLRPDLFGPDVKVKAPCVDAA